MNKKVVVTKRVSTDKFSVQIIFQYPFICKRFHKQVKKEEGGKI